jgi:hypothetical protein
MDQEASNAYDVAEEIYSIEKTLRGDEVTPGMKRSIAEVGNITRRFLAGGFVRKHARSNDVRLVQTFLRAMLVGAGNGDVRRVRQASSALVTTIESIGRYFETRAESSTQRQGRHQMKQQWKVTARLLQRILQVVKRKPVEKRQAYKLGVFLRKAVRQIQASVGKHQVLTLHLGVPQLEKAIDQLSGLATLHHLPSDYVQGEVPHRMLIDRIAGALSDLQSGV